MTKQGKWTPGPWEVQRLNHVGGETWLQIGWRDQNGHSVGPIAEIAGGAVKPFVPSWSPVAELKYLIASDEQQAANARLIAAAPAMAEALQRLADLAQCYCNEATDDMRRGQPKPYQCPKCEAEAALKAAGVEEAQ